MPRLAVLASLGLLAFLAAPAQAGRLTARSTPLHALAVDPQGRALAVVDSGRSAAAFRLLRSAGGRGRDLGIFGDPRAEFPDVAADRRSAFVSWSRPVSGGSELSFAPVIDRRIGRRVSAGQSTGPARLTVGAGDAVLAFPDEVGDVVLWPPPVSGDFAYGPQRPRRLTRDAPGVRHHPLAAVTTARGTLVLDLAQRPRRTALVVVGAGAPAGAVVSIPALRHLDAAMGASDELVAVAYMSRGRAVLATARPEGGWRRRRLPGAGGGADAPVPVVDGDRVHVAYAQRVRGRREIIVATVSGGRVRTEQLTTSRADDRAPKAALGPDGELYVGWTSRAPRSRRYAARIERLG